MSQEKEEKDYEFYDLFVPLTTKKVIIFFVLVGIFVYFNMLFNALVWDDLTYIVRNRDMHTINLAYAFGPNMFNVDGQYRPIPAFYYSAMYTIFGYSPFIFHSMQLLLHISSVILLFFIFKLFFQKNISFFLALLFLVHPMNIESVGYFAQSTNPIFFLFGGSAFLLSTKKNLSYKRLLAIFSLALLSILTKETGILFLFLIVLYRILYSKSNIVKVISGSILSVGIYVLIRVFIGQVLLSVRQLAPIASISLDERILTMPKIMFYYIKTFFFPSTLVIDQQWVVKTFSIGDVLIPLVMDLLCILFVLITGFLIWKKHRKLFRTYLFFSLWYAAGFLFISQLFPLDATVADRWFYFPMVGLIGLIGVLFNVYISKINSKKQTIFLVALLIILSLLSVRTIVRNSNWYNVFTLYSHDSKIIDNFHLENNLGYEYSLINDNTKAIYHFKKSVELWPYELNLLNLGGAYMRTGDTKNAKKYLEMALALDTNDAYSPHKHDVMTYLNYTAILLTTDTPENTERFLKGALADYPDNSSLLVLDAFNKLQLNRRKDALSILAKAQKLAPKDPFIAHAYANISKNKPVSFNYAGKKYTFK